jgi:hypothetical protein
VKKLEPTEVAEAIVDALRFPKFDVWVPASSAVIDKLIHPLPRRAKEVIARVMRADQVLAAPNRSERAAYEDRAARPLSGTEREAQASTEESEDKSPSLS